MNTHLNKNRNSGMETPREIPDFKKKIGGGYEEKLSAMSTTSGGSGLSRIRFMFADDDDDDNDGNNGEKICLPKNNTDNNDTDVKCYNCNSVDNFDNSDLITCLSCGTIQDRPFDSKAEYRMFSNDDRGNDPTRIGAPQDPTLPQSSLSTVILYHPHGGGGKGFNKDIFKIRKIHSWNNIPYKERALIQAYERLSQVCTGNGINNAIIETAKNLYVTVKDVAGRSGVCRDAMLSACIYMALKDCSSPRKPKDISAMFGITTTVFTKAMKKLQSILMMARQKGRISVSMARRMEGTTTNASEYMLLPLSRIGIPKEDQEFIYRMGLIVYGKIKDMSFCQENMPPSLAGGCLAFIIDRFRSELTTKAEITHAVIADACEISVATLEKCLRRLIDHAAEIWGEEAETEEAETEAEAEEAEAEGAEAEAEEAEAETEENN